MAEGYAGQEVPPAEIGRNQDGKIRFNNKTNGSVVSVPGFVMLMQEKAGVWIVETYTIGAPQ